MSSDDASFLLADAEQPMNAHVSCLKSTNGTCHCACAYVALSIRVITGFQSVYRKCLATNFRKLYKG